jgi:hypothetical protein
MSFYELEDERDSAPFLQMSTSSRATCREVRRPSSRAHPRERAHDPNPPLFTRQLACRAKIAKDIPRFGEMVNVDTGYAGMQESAQWRHVPCALKQHRFRSLFGADKSKIDDTCEKVEGFLSLPRPFQDWVCDCAEEAMGGKKAGPLPGVESDSDSDSDSDSEDDDGDKKKKKVRPAAALPRVLQRPPYPPRAPRSLNRFSI